MGIASLISIAFQAFVFMIISWMTLGCKFYPQKTEYHEVTLVKMLYLFDPDVCGKVFFYNHTLNVDNNKVISSIIWPNHNGITRSFRHKISVWVALHVLWLLCAISYETQDARRCGFYASILPFTLIGVAILMFDLVNTVIFIIDAFRTETELDILLYIELSLDSENSQFVILNSFYKYAIPAYGVDTLKPKCDDTSWIALMMAFFSSKFIVQWFVNLWIIKDTYMEGLSYKHASLKQKKFSMDKEAIDIHKKKSKRRSQYSYF